MRSALAVQGDDQFSGRRDRPSYVQAGIPRGNRYGKLGFMFTDEMLRALNNWQKGWSEHQTEKVALAKELLLCTSHLAQHFRNVHVPCYRKRFVHKGELVDLLLKDHLEEGITSWTTNRNYAEIFKGKHRQGAVSAAIYCHTPNPKEVVVNVTELWRDSSFVVAAESLRARHPSDTAALFNFKDSQAEVVLKDVPLKGSEVVALSGASSSFDELCDAGGIPEGARDELHRQLIASGCFPGELTYTYFAPDVIARTIQRILKKMDEARSQH